MKILILLILTIFLVSCVNSTDINSKDATWMEIDPIQCLGNPWEVDWINSHSYEEYPRDIITPELEKEEIEIIKDYYANQDIVIIEIESKWTKETVCEACMCPEGYTLYILISNLNIEKLEKLGYKNSYKNS